MRIVSVAFVLCVLPLAYACATAPSDGSQQVQTTRQANKENLQGAVAAPLRDTNVLRTKIPEVLLDAMADPYARPQPGNCRRLAALIGPLDEALGPDLDVPPLSADDTMAQGRDLSLGAVANLASSAIPFRSWVRMLSGAERHDQLVQNAIIGGAVRRAYLKGLGETRGCSPPATPSHVLTQIRAEAEAQARAKALAETEHQPDQPPPEPGKPRYPVR